MFDEQRLKRMKELMELIAKEQETDRFSKLVAEFNQLADEEMPHEGPSSRPPGS